LSHLKENELVIKLDGISTIYEGERNPAVHDIDLMVRKGEFLCVLGPNGAGKTTLLEAVNGILPLTSGSGRVLGMDLEKKDHSIRKRTGYVIQNFDIDPLAPFLVKDIVMGGRAGKLGLLSFPGKKEWALVARYLEEFGLIGFDKRPVGKLSGGEFQRMLLARAMVQEPELLLLDEPFSNLDAKMRGTVEDVLTKYHNKTNFTAVMVSHDIGNIPRICDRIIIIDNGRIVADGKKEDILGSKEFLALLPGGMGGK